MRLTDGHNGTGIHRLLKTIPSIRDIVETASANPKALYRKGRVNGLKIAVHSTDLTLRGSILIKDIDEGSAALGRDESGDNGSGEEAKK